MLPPGTKSLSEIVEINDPAIRVILYGTLLEWVLKSFPSDAPVAQNLDSLIEHHSRKFASFGEVDGARWVRNQVVHGTSLASFDRIKRADAEFPLIIRRLAEQYCSPGLHQDVTGN